jgi:uncharacterized protein (TIGR00730 family)
MNSELLPTRVAIHQVKARLQATLEEYWHLDTHLREIEDTNFRVCLFGSARITAADPLYRTVFDLSRALAARGMDVVTGGGPGLMEAANAGVRAASVGGVRAAEMEAPGALTRARSRSYGLTLDVPTLNEAANAHLDIKSSHKRFSSRLDEFVRLSHGVVVAPGGIGTMLELMYVWQLQQVGMIEPRPIVLLGTGFWRGFLQWVQETQAEGGYLSLRDLEYLEVADDLSQVVERMAREQALYRLQRSAFDPGRDTTCEASAPDHARTG